MSKQKISLAIVEDNESLRRNLSEMIRREPAWKLVGEFADAESALAKLPSIRPSVVLMDINLPGMRGVECVARLTQLLPDTLVVMVTVYDDSDTIFESLSSGASGYLLKPVQSEQLVAAIEEVIAGGAPMSMSIARRVVQTFRKPAAPEVGDESQLWPREVEILELLAKGFLKKEIAEKLGISYWTVQTHVGRIYKKLHVHSRGQAVAKFRGL